MINKEASLPRTPRPVFHSEAGAGLERYVDMNQVADFIGVTLATLRKWRQHGKMPFPTYGKERFLRFKLSEVDQWMQNSAHFNPAEVRAMRG
ncbi:helix-turn-helix transcriptional regulator [Woodsholea maritima]|uniref:helix-turn-helix transcriptional regulator n=1 Tax=Woodsholea maritima TaxID=240237 RepID=UPI0003669AD4